jgi:hypothetical protein
MQVAVLPSSSCLVTVSFHLRGMNNWTRPPVTFGHKSRLLSQLRVLTSTCCWNLWAECRAQLLVRVAGHEPCHAAPVS